MIRVILVREQNGKTVEIARFSKRYDAEAALPFDNRIWLSVDFGKGCRVVFRPEAVRHR